MDIFLQCIVADQRIYSNNDLRDKASICICWFLLNEKKTSMYVMKDFHQWSKHARKDMNETITNGSDPPKYQEISTTPTNDIHKKTRNISKTLSAIRTVQYCRSKLKFWITINTRYIPSHLPSTNLYPGLQPVRLQI